jgi:type II restriction enzyme
MFLDKEQIIEIEKTIEDSLKRKLKEYKPEKKYMPFHYRLLGKDRVLFYSFIHSLNTYFGASIFESVALILSRKNFVEVHKQYHVGNLISTYAQAEIQGIIDELASGQRNPNKFEEIERIRKVVKSGKLVKTKVVKVDIFLKDKDGMVHMFDLKTAKPNISEFKTFKRTLLEWIAIYLQRESDARINSYIAIPYNPYYPGPYERWTIKGMIDINNELKVAEEFWDFLGGDGAYEELLKCFERVGIKLRPELDECFSRFKGQL